MRRALNAVLAFAIRYQPQLTGRAENPLRLSSPSARAAHTPSPKSAAAPMSKVRPETDVPNPFIPSSSPVCRVADTALLFCVALAGLAAAGVSLIRQIACPC